jgi:hypothetical protein
MQMDIAKLGSHPLPVGPEIENTAIKPPSPGTPREGGASENTEQASGHASPLANLSKRPLDEPAVKAFLSEKLNVGNSGYSGPQIRMDDRFGGTNLPDGAGGQDVGDAPSGDGWSLTKSEDPKSLNSNDDHIPKSGDDSNGPTRGAGFTFNVRGRTEGDGNTKATSGATGSSSAHSSSTSTQSNSSSSSSSSGTTGTSSTSGTHPQKK